MKILVVDDDQQFANRITKALSVLEVSIENTLDLPATLSYDFYILGRISDFCETMEQVRSQDKKGKIFLSGPFCEQKVSAKKLIKYEIEACVDRNASGISDLLQAVAKACKSRKQLSEAGKKLDRMKKEVLKSSSSTSHIPLLY